MKMLQCDVECITDNLAALESVQALFDCYTDTSCKDRSIAHNVVKKLDEVIATIHNLEEV